jgi:hypothetical protein
MSLTLTNPVLLPLLAMVAVPILLHLFARARPPVYRFSSVLLIQRVVRHTMRVKRPQDWLLLVLRTCLLTALVGAFLQPVLYLAGSTAATGQRRVVVIVDASASMAWVDGAQTRFATACAEAGEVLAGLGTADLANVIWLDATPTGVFPRLGRNVSYLQQALRRGRVTSEAGDVDAALRLALEMLAAEPDGSPSLCLVSDFQTSTWKQATVALPDTIPTVRIRVGAPETPAPNTALSRITCEPAVPLVGEDAAVSCEVRNLGPEPRRCTVFLTVEESRQSRAVVVPAWGSAEAVFACRLRSAGEFVAAARLEEDAFPGDDAGWWVGTARAAVRVGLADADAALAGRWRQALAALDWVQLTALAPGDLEAELPYDVVLLAGWAGNSAGRLRRFVEAQGRVIVAPAAELPGAALAALTGSPARESSARVGWEALEPPRRLRLCRVDDPVFRLFATGEYGDPAGGRFRGRWRVPLDCLPGDGTALMEYEDGAPALLRYRGSGSVFVWNLPLAPEHSDFAGRVEFVPLLGEVLLSCRAAGPGTDRLGEVTCGEPLCLDLPDGALAAEVELRDGAGAVVPTALCESGSRCFAQAEGSLDPGLYTWQRGGVTVSRAAVNFPRPESDLRLQPDSALARAGGVFRGGADLRRLREGVVLWPWLLALAAVAALAEGIVLPWAERSG